MRRVLVTGSREWVDRAAIWTALQSELTQFPEGIIVVHGAAKGADDIADRWAWGMLQVGWPIEVEPHPASDFMPKFDRKRAPLVRNQFMVDLGADVVHAFPLEGGTGTRHCMTRAYAAGLHVVNHGYPPYTQQSQEFARAYG